MTAKTLGQVFDTWVRASRQDKFVAWIVLQQALKAYKSGAK